MILKQLENLDLTRLFEIACEIVSVETVEEIHEMAAKIQQAAEIAKEAGLRLLGYRSRSLKPELRELVDRAENEYLAQTLTAKQIAPE